MPSHSRITFRPVLRSALLLTASPFIAAIAQVPTTKPAPGSSVRLPAPRTIVATQESDGRIRVVWSAVPGATSYALVRSVPPTPATPIVPNPTDTVFFDSDVVVGRTYYYVVAGVNDAGAAGLKTGSAPLKATGPAPNTGTGPTSITRPVVPSPTNFVATLQGTVVELRWDYGGRPGLTFRAERRIASDPNAQWQGAGFNGLPTGPSNPGGNMWVSVMAPPGSRLGWRITAIDAASGASSSPTLSNEVAIPGTPASSGGSTAATPTGSAVGTVAVSMGASVSLRAGSTASLVSALGGSNASHWVSLDAGTATVDASGTATGRASGRAQILALGRSPDGSVRVTLVVVTVTP